jgi:LAO/AO transport system kinase
MLREGFTTPDNVQKKDLFFYHFTKSYNMKNMLQKIIRGDQLAGARLIRLLEEGDPEGMEMLKLLYPNTGNAYVLGMTGPPGSGKSTLINCIISEFRQSGTKVAVVAIDPGFYPLHGHPRSSGRFEQDYPGDSPGV